MAGREVDVLVIGGGITGAGVALDAASRGLSVGLVEREDFAAGTSGRSSRLIHGGARYLQHGELGLVSEAIRERRLLLRLAPHLVRPQAFLVPVRGWSNRLYVGFGLSLYDAVASGRNVRRHQWVPADEVVRLAPSLRRRSGGYVSWDCRTDDARLTLEVLRQAVRHGALVANHAEVEDFAGHGRVRGAGVRERLTGSGFGVRARITVNATGAWADRVNALAAPPPRRLRPSKGIHVVLERSRLPVGSGVIIPSAAEGFIFVLPWGPRVYAGTTDTSHRGPLDRPTVEPEDVDVVLDSLGRAFGGDLGPSDVRASWAGIRPLLDTGRGATRGLSRRHVVYEDPPGLVTVTGGKLTTYRAMGEEVVDHVCRSLGKGGRCRTGGIRLGLSESATAATARATEAATGLGEDTSLGARLVARYGDDWEEALRLIAEDRALAEEVVPSLPVRAVELELARTREMALTEEDVLERRTRLTTMDRAAASMIAASR